ncbi:Flp pilus assembly protein CpaB [Desulfitobacterium chlororespirans]|uniref:Pilus assembly protein CpaB n=1 Tax=Desulfitobacterium chlororespirans DSM 11544 TaxID=1121395 RepID=A0A1M7UY99_9FIRM|nr:Flp pilus assembly protein CpaB [Desulfitobacterium chlororespirans]SHN87912.1 pilus assembly protein CpaB [Desulfitobacterium chlororespirans DSM 11544]
MFKIFKKKDKEVVKVQKEPSSGREKAKFKSEQESKPKGKLELNLDQFKNRTAIGIACIALAFMIVFGLSPLINKAATAQTTIVRISKDIEAGERITADKLEKVTVGGYNLPDNVIKSTEEVLGQYATMGLKKGDYILSSKVSSDSFFNSPYLYNLPEGKVAISVSLKSQANGLSGKLQNGDIISIIALDGQGAEKKALQLPELTYVEVLAAVTKKGIDNTQKDQSDSKEQDEIATAILSVNPTQALKLAEYEENGKLHMTLVCRGNEELKSQLLETQEKYFEQTLKANDDGVQEGDDHE